LISDYHAQDDISTLQSNQIFYRLKLVDEDGRFFYSKVIAFKINSTQNDLTIYPNPARTEIFISLTTDKRNKLHVKILDASGKTLYDQQKEIQKGNNIFPVTTSRLKAGSYLLQLILNGETKTSKFNVIK